MGILKSSYIDEENQAHRIDFASLHELAEYIKEADTIPDSLKAELASSRQSFRSAGMEYKKAAAIIDNAGYSKPDIDRLTDRLTEVSLDAPNSRFLSSNCLIPAIAGGMPSVTRYLTGQPKNMLVRAKIRPSKPVLKIAVPVGYCHKVKQHEVENAGSVAYNIINALEAQGYAVELVGTFYATASFRAKKVEAFLLTVTLKPADTPLDIAALAYPLMNQAFLRRNLFRLVEHDKKIRPATNDSYGYERSLIKGFDLELPKPSKIFRTYNNGFDFTVKLLAESGIRLK